MAANNHNYHYYHHYHCEEDIMNSIKIPHHKSVYYQYMVEDRDLINFIDNRSKNNNNIGEYLEGGDRVKKIKYRYENYDFLLYERKIQEGYDISIRRKDDIEEPQTCLHLMCNSKIGIAYLQNISYYKDCVKIGLRYPGGGSILLKMLIKFVKENKSRYNIRRIQLKDNSKFFCKKIKDSIEMPIMSILLFGDTWYRKYGFRPYRSDTDEKHKQGCKRYKRNIQITKNTIVKNTKLFDLIYVALKKVKKDYTDDQIKKFVLKLREERGSYNVNDFFKAFLRNYDKTCELFNLFYEEYFDSIGLYNFFGESFYLDV